MTSRQNYGGSGFGFGNLDDQIFGPNGLLGQVFGQQGSGGPFGPQGFGQQNFGPRRGGPRGGYGPQGGPRRARRGDVRNAVLHLLQREPMNGYQLMQEIEQSSGGAWRPSSGAIYPALQQLEDEGLVAQTEVEGRRAYELTQAGRAAAEDLPPQGWAGGEEPDDPWADDTHRGGSRGGRGRRGPGHGHRHGGPGGRQGTGRSSAGTLWKALGSVAMATQAVGQSGQDDLSREAAELLDRTRRDLYRMLAEAEVARDDADEDQADRHDDPDEITEGEIVEE